MSAALDAVPGGVLTLSDDLRILAANRAMGEIVGRSPADLVGQSIDVLLTPPSRILLQTHVYPALRADGRVEEVLLSLAGADGATTPVLLNGVRTSGPDGLRYDVLIVRFRARSRWEVDLLSATRALEGQRAASRQLADELADALAELTARIADEQRNREFRDAFVGVMSHELRTPITTIFGMSHVLRQRHRGMDPDQVQEGLGDIVDQTDRLRRLVEDLLVLSRAEGGGLVIAADPVLVPRLVQRVVADEAALATGHRFAVDAPIDVPLVAGEDAYIEQVLHNFLTNATKYSPPGTTIHVTAREESDGTAVRVVDEGPGLPEGDPERLFELFYRSPEAVGHQPGAGIGLYVCRELIHAMNGRVWARPASGLNGRGAEFGFWLPAAPEE